MKNASFIFQRLQWKTIARYLWIRALPIPHLYPFQNLSPCLVNANCDRNSVDIDICLMKYLQRFYFSNLQSMASGVFEWQRITRRLRNAFMIRNFWQFVCMQYNCHGDCGESANIYLSQDVYQLFTIIFFVSLVRA